MTRETVLKTLRAGERLTKDIGLASAGNDAQLQVGQGSLAIRTSFHELRHEVRTAPANGVAYVLMQRDGNLVAYTEDRHRVWASQTAGQPGAFAVMSDSGDLVIRSSTGQDLWTSAAAMDWRTVKTTDARGYHFDGTSPGWDKACESLPCFENLAWPGYRTEVIERQVRGQDVVIQLWKGRCQRFLGLDDFPGGIGAEVGVYKRRDNVPLPRRLDLGNPFLNAWMLANLRFRAGDDVWWAAPEMEAKIVFEFINPITGEVIFGAEKENTYWLNKWMYPEDYGRYGEAAGRNNMPQSSSHCLMRYSIDDEPMQYWPGDDPNAAYNPAPVEMMASVSRQMVH